MTGIAQRLKRLNPAVRTIAVEPAGSIVFGLATPFIVRAMDGAPAMTRIATAVANDDLVLEWAEVGGPAVAGEPERTGFGTVLSEISIRDQLGGQLERHWHARGLQVDVRVPCRNLRRQGFSAE